MMLFVQRRPNSGTGQSPGLLQGATDHCDDEDDDEEEDIYDDDEEDTGQSLHCW